MSKLIQAALLVAVGYLVENAARDGKIGLWALALEKRIEPCGAGCRRT
jgi:hypothetical protein